MQTKLVNKINDSNQHEFFLYQLKLILREQKQIKVFEEALYYYYNDMPNGLQIISKKQLDYFNEQTDLLLEFFYGISMIKVDTNVSFDWQGKYFDQLSQNKSIFYEICMLLFYKFQQNLNFCLQNQQLKCIQNILGNCLFYIDYIKKFLDKIFHNGTILFELNEARLEYLYNFVLSFFSLIFFQQNKDQIKKSNLLKQILTNYNIFSNTKILYGNMIRNFVKFDLKEFQEFVYKYYIYFRCKLFYYFSIQCEALHEQQLAKGYLGIQIKSLQILNQDLSQYKFYFKDDNDQINKFQKQINRIKYLIEYNNNFKQPIPFEQDIDLGESFSLPQYEKKNIFVKKQNFQIEAEQIDSQFTIQNNIDQMKQFENQIQNIKNQEIFRKFFIDFDQYIYYQLKNIKSQKQFDQIVNNKINSIASLYQGVDGQKKKIAELIQMGKKNMHKITSLSDLIKNLQTDVNIFNRNFDSDLQAFDPEIFGYLINGIFEQFQKFQLIQNRNLNGLQQTYKDLIAFTKENYVKKIQVKKFKEIKDLYISYELIRDELKQDQEIPLQKINELNQLKLKFKEFFDTNQNEFNIDTQNINNFLISINTLEESNWILSQFQEIQEKFEQILNDVLKIFIRLEIAKKNQIKILAKYFQEINFKQEYFKYFKNKQLSN